MADIIDDKQASSTNRVVGRDEVHAVDVIQEDGENKMLVKASAVPQTLANLFFDYAIIDGASQNAPFDLNVNGSGTPVDFYVLPDATDDKIINSLVFQAFDGGIKINTFLGQNSELDNGIMVEIKSNDEIFQFQPIKNTQEFDSLFSFGGGRSFELIFASGVDSMVARFGSDIPFILKPQGTYATDDYIKVTVSDNISNITRLRFLAVGQVDS